MLFLGMGLTMSASRTAGVAPIIKPGWDWSLPPGTRPAPGQYGWSLPRDRIAQCRRNGMKVGLHLMGVERPGVSPWVMDKFHPPVVDVPPLQEGQPWRLQVVPPGTPGVDRAFRDFLAAFGQTGIA